MRKTEIETKKWVAKKGDIVYSIISIRHGLYLASIAKYGNDGVLGSESIEFTNLESIVETDYFYDQELLEKLFSHTDLRIKLLKEILSYYSPVKKYDPRKSILEDAIKFLQ